MGAFFWIFRGYPNVQTLNVKVQSMTRRRRLAVWLGVNRTYLVLLLIAKLWRGESRWRCGGSRENCILFCTTCAITVLLPLVMIRTRRMSFLEQRLISPTLLILPISFYTIGVEKSSSSHDTDDVDYKRRKGFPLAAELPTYAIVPSRKKRIIINRFEWSTLLPVFKRGWIIRNVIIDGGIRSLSRVVGGFGFPVILSYANQIIPLMQKKFIPVSPIKGRPPISAPPLGDYWLPEQEVYWRKLVSERQSSMDLPFAYCLANGVRYLLL